MSRLSPAIIRRAPGLQIVGTRMNAVTATRAGNTSSRSDIQMDCRIRMYTGAVGASGLRVAVSGTLVKAAGVEENFPNDYVAEFAIENAGASAFERFLFGGSNTITVTPGSFTISDPVAMNVTPGALFFLRQGYTISNVAHFFPSRNLQWAAGSGDFQAVSPAVVSQVAATGAMSNPSGGTTSLGVGAAMPYAILGRYSSPIPSVGILGDSIGESQGDQLSASSQGLLGFIPRGLENVNGFTLPYINFSISSNRLQYDTPANGPSKRLLYKYLTHLIVELGNNDPGGSRSLAQMQADLTAICDEAKRTIGPYGKRLKVAVCTITPRVSSTDSYATLANQTVTTNYTAAGVRGQYNDWLVTQEGILFDYLIDTRSVTNDATETDKWVVTGAANYATNDGVHPRGVMHSTTNMGGVVNAVASKFRV